MQRQRRRQWMWCIRAHESGGGGGGGCSDRDGISGCGAVELTSEATAAVVDAATEMASVDVVHAS